MYFLIFFFLIISVLTPLFGRYLGSKFSIIISIISLLFAFVFASIIFFEVVYHNFTTEVILFTWLNFFSIYAPFVLFFDKLSVSMLFLVIFISTLVHIYAWNYMENDPSVLRFFFFLSLFTFFMCFMVIAGNILHFFFAWEGVGLSSYLLINFWYTRAEANRSAMKAMIVNRFGDFGLYFAMLMVFAFYKTLDFCTLNAVSHYTRDITVDFFNYSFNLQEFICFFFFIAVIGKSAQLGFHTWLPDAMEGPTPVSALLHAATMVTAGVYLLLRIAFVLENTPNIMLLLSFWGALTAFFASSVGAFQNDIKKIIAYSTCSQLGYMVSSCGMYNFIGAYFHLFNHAFFKALLFLGAGSVIHAMIDEQDLRKYGLLINYLPFTYISMLIGSFSLVGFPFLSGYYSKEMIINWSFSASIASEFYSTVYWLLVFAAYFTAYYSTKIIYLTFFSRSPRFSRTILSSAHEGDVRFVVPLAILAFLSIFSGIWFYDLFLGYGGDFLNLPVNQTSNFYYELEFLEAFRKNLPIFFVFAGSLTYLYWTIFFQENFNILLKNRFIMKFFIWWKNFFNKKWFFDYFYFFIVKLFMYIAYDILFKTFDRGFLEIFFIKNSIFSSLAISRMQQNYLTGSVNTYICYFVSLFLNFGFIFIYIYCNLDVIFLFFYLTYLLKEFLSKNFNKNIFND